MDYLTDLWANADSIVVVSALFMTLSGLAVVLRFATKPFIKQGIKLDDGFIVLGLLFYYAEEIFQLKGMWTYTCQKKKANRLTIRTAVLIGRTSTSVADPNFVQYFKVWARTRYNSFDTKYFTLVALLGRRMVFPLPRQHQHLHPNPLPTPLRHDQRSQRLRVP